MISELVLIRHFGENNLIYLVEKLPQLSQLTIVDGISLTADGLINLVTIGIQLTELNLRHVRNLHINKNVFTALFSVIQSDDSKRHLTITIRGSKSGASFDVSEQLQRSCKQNLILEKY